MAQLKKSLYRIIDANLNRALEGIRVSEDIARFALSDKKSTLLLKQIRHAAASAAKIIEPDYCAIVSSRDSEKDAGRSLNPKSEFKKSGLKEILISNLKRAQESLRVLEETAKLIDIKAAASFKEARYNMYTAEKNILKKRNLK
ncbi:MAG: thiamine-phosphate pyrophosphorylase [Candidatus Goldbacteria bacterium]|nr:thiamine-phosphate pyrophosphorylase [Candidatus Goldiibacteriota bacterium]